METKLQNKQPFVSKWQTLKNFRALKVLKIVLKYMYFCVDTPAMFRKKIVILI